MISVKCLPKNPRGTVDIGAVAAVTINTVQRASAPYPPGNVQVNGQAWPNGATLHGDVTLTWAHRIRTAQTGTTIVHQDAGDTPGTIEGQYKVEVLVGGVAKQIRASITGTSYTYTWAQRIADDPDPTKPVQFRIAPVNGGLSGISRTTDAFLMTG